MLKTFSNGCMNEPDHACRNKCYISNCTANVRTVVSDGGVKLPADVPSVHALAVEKYSLVSCTVPNSSSIFPTCMEVADEAKVRAGTCYNSPSHVQAVLGGVVVTGVLALSSTVIVAGDVDANLTVEAETSSLSPPQMWHSLCGVATPGYPTPTPIGATGDVISPFFFHWPYS